MNEKLVVFDVETPNKKNDRISAIGVCIIEENQIASNNYWLVNPECMFDDFNIELTGISPSAVAEAPTFPEIWKILEPLFRESLIVAHNATFDLCVLKKTLQAYNLDTFPVFYLDTLKVARNNVPIEHHRLGDLCRYFDIELDAHNALSDCLACAQLTLLFNNDGIEFDNYISQYRLDSVECNNKREISVHLSNSSQALITLIGILQGITCDDILSDEEVFYLEKWLKDNQDLKGNYPYDKIYKTVFNALEDGILEESEISDMLILFKNVANPIQDCSCDCEKLDLNGKIICLTGEFDFGNKLIVEEYLKSKR